MAKQKSLYPDDELTDWIEESAENSNRSESEFMATLLEMIRDNVDGHTIDTGKVDELEDILEYDEK